MEKVIFDMGMSLDGLVKASNATPEQPLGDGGQRLPRAGLRRRTRPRGPRPQGGRLGRGTRMFEHLGGEHMQPEILDVIETRAARHLRFRIRR